VGFVGQVIFDDGGKSQIRSSWGFWQGRKFSVDKDSLKNAVWGSGGDAAEADRPHSPGYGGYGKERKSSRHVSFLDTSTRKYMLNSVKEKTALHNSNLDKWSTLGTGPQAFIPKLRPRILVGKLDSSAEITRHGVSSPLRSLTRTSSSGTIAGAEGSAGSHLLTELNLPSLAEADMEYTIHVEPLSTALSVDGELALFRLNQAGPNAKFCDKVFDATSDSLLAKTGVSAEDAEPLLEGVQAWMRPEELGIKEDVVLLGESTQRASDVIQGELGDCYLLGAMSVVASRRDLLDQIFSHFNRLDASVTHQTLLERGIVTIQLYKVKIRLSDFTQQRTNLHIVGLLVACLFCWRTCPWNTWAKGLSEQRGLGRTATDTLTQT
jgi:hypothetical protein